MKTIFFSRRWKSLLLTSKQSPQGFTILEVLAALMISFAFLVGTLNTMIMTAYMQVKAERQAQAGNWIQQDLENVRYLAATQATNTALCTSTFSGSYAGALRTTLGASTTLTKSLAYKSYNLVRVTSGSDSNPQILTISYTVSNSSDPSSLATLYTEIIPSPALSCS